MSNCPKPRIKAKRGAGFMRRAKFVVTKPKKPSAKIPPPTVLTPVLRNPTEAEQHQIAEALDRRIMRKRRPVKVAFDDQGLVDSPHADRAGHVVALAEALGTTSLDFVRASIGRLEHASRSSLKARGESAVELNADLALVHAIAPQDELEATLAVQMAGTHALATELLGRARQTDNTEHLQLYGNLAVKLLRTFPAQVEALARHRGKGEQTVTVEHIHKHVTVQPGAQAIVGDVHHHLPRGAGDRTESGVQSDAPPSHAAVAALPGPDQARDGVPVPSRRRKAAVPDARRHKSRPSKG